MRLNSEALCLGRGEEFKSTDKGRRLTSTVGEETPETQSVTSSDTSETIEAAAVGSCHPSKEGGPINGERGYGLVDSQGLIIESSDEKISTERFVGASDLRVKCEENLSLGECTPKLDDSSFAFRLLEKKPSVRSAPFTCMTLTAWLRMIWVFRKDVKWWAYRWPILFTTFICILTSMASIVEEVLVWWWPTVRGHIKPVHKPLFILGHYRSGTTLMHHIITHDEDQFIYTANRHCM